MPEFSILSQRFPYPSARVRRLPIVVVIATVAGLLGARVSRAQPARSGELRSSVAQYRATLPAFAAGRAGFIDDWSGRHLLYSAIAPGSSNHPVLEEPRYWAARAQRLAAMRPVRAAAVPIGTPLRRVRMRRDWSFSLGNGATVGDGMFPAKFSFDITTASCTADFVVFNTGLAGVTGGQPNIVGLTNLYAGCGGTVPTVAWAYATGPGQVLTSPTLSLDGTKVAFVENTRGGAILRILQWQAGEGSFDAASGTWSAAAVDNTSLKNWSSCQANQSCMISLVFSGNPNNTNSPPFYNFEHNTLYVGDDAGLIHRFNDVFSGSPAEIRSNFPITVDSGAKLTGPVYDGVSGNIFVGDSTGKLWYIRETGSRVGTCVSGSPPCLGDANIDVGSGSGQPIIDGPMVDPTTEKVFAFDGCSESGGGACTPSSPGAAEVVQTGVTLSGAVRAPLGLGSAGGNLHDGAFDNNYLAGNLSSGHLYTCGNTLTTSGRSLFSVGFDSSGLMLTDPAVGPALTGAAQNLCSPVTEIFNAGVDRIFVSVPGSGTAAIAARGQPCTGACLYSYDVTSGMLTSSSTASIGLSVSSGTSGIIIDNTAASPAGTSQVYFSALANGAAPCSTSGGIGGCAVQASQAALQ